MEQLLAYVPYLLCPVAMGRAEQPPAQFPLPTRR